MSTVLLFLWWFSKLNILAIKHIQKILSDTVITQKIREFIQKTDNFFNLIEWCYALYIFFPIRLTKLYRSSIIGVPPVFLCVSKNSIGIRYTQIKYMMCTHWHLSILKTSLTLVDTNCHGFFMKKKTHVVYSYTIVSFT